MPLPKGFSGFPEPQYTKTPNIIFDCLLSDLSGSQLKTLLFVVRKTMGWRREHEMVPISIAQIQEATGLSKEPVIDALRWLCDSKLILRQKQRGFEGRQGTTSYRLRFTDDADIPESENPTLENEQPLDSRVGLVDNFSDPGSTPIIIVFKEKKEKENNTPSLVPLEPETQQDPPEVPSRRMSPTLDDDGDLPEEGRRPFKRNWKRPKPERPHGMSDRLRELREGAAANAGAGVDRLIPPMRPVTSASAAANDPTASQAKIVTFPQRWNELVPERPVDADLLAPNPPAYREPVFGSRFDEICAKAKPLIAAGAALEFGFLLGTDRGTGQYRWQQLLAGQLGWLVKGSGGKEVKKPVDGRAMAAQWRTERLAKEAQEKANAAGTKAADQNPG